MEILVKIATSHKRQVQLRQTHFQYLEHRGWTIRRNGSGSTSPGKGRRRCCCRTRQIFRGRDVTCWIQTPAGRGGSDGGCSKNSQGAGRVHQNSKFGFSGFLSLWICSLKRIDLFIETHCLHLSYMRVFNIFPWMCFFLVNILFRALWFF